MYFGGILGTILIFIVSNLDVTNTKVSAALERFAWRTVRPVMPGRPLREKSPYTLCASAGRQPVLGSSSGPSDNARCAPAQPASAVRLAAPN
jgi:hypothetical protein